MTRRLMGGGAVLLLVVASLASSGCAANWAYRQGQGEAKKGNWDLAVARDVRETELPTADVLRVIREYDPGGFWTRRDE